MENKKYFDILQIYRGIAALLVVVHHTYISFEYFKGLDIPILGMIASIGKLGVDFFFVLSGFIIAYTTYQHRDNPKYYKKYIFNRLVRIYVPYLPVSVGLILLYLFLPGFSGAERSVSLLTSLTLIPHGNPALSVAWTLVFEMFFYIVYSLNFFSKKVWYGFLILWILSILGFNIFNWEANGALLHTVTNLYNLEFISGVFVAYAIRKGLKLSLITSLIGAIGVFIFFLYIKFSNLHLFKFDQNLIFTLSMIFWVYVGVEFWSFKIKKSHLMMLIGNSSYSLYLLHNPMQSFLVRLLPESSIQVVLIAEIILVIIICCIISYFYYLIFEKKAILVIKDRFAF